MESRQGNDLSCEQETSLSTAQTTFLEGHGPQLAGRDRRSFLDVQPSLRQGEAMAASQLSFLAPIENTWTSVSYRYVGLHFNRKFLGG